MPINILMPALSPTMEKGNLAKWLKKEGDKVKSGDIIAEIETDKATMEVEAVDEGTIAKIVVPEGTADVPVNQVIAVLAGEGEDVKSRRGRSRPGRTRAEAAGRRTGCASAERTEGRSAETRACCRSAAPKPQAAAPQPASSRRSRLCLAAGQAARQGSRHRPCAASRAPARMAASSRATSKARNPARACKPRGRAGRRSLGAVHRAARCRTSRSARCSKRAATRSCRTTACAAPSRSGSRNRRRPSRIST